MFVDDAPLKNVRASWPFCRGSCQPATPAVQKVFGARKHQETIADSANELGYLVARLADSRDAHKANPRTRARHRATYQWTAMLKNKRASAEVAIYQNGSQAIKVAK
jgi:hypothetical protein